MFCLNKVKSEKNNFGRDKEKWLRENNLDIF